eukprot:scaffold9735_cov106-Cylindrotheca_fusiformis.AAC.4
MPGFYSSRMQRAPTRSSNKTKLMDSRQQRSTKCCSTATPLSKDSSSITRTTTIYSFSTTSSIVSDNSSLRLPPSTMMIPDLPEQEEEDWGYFVDTPT